MEQEKIDRIRTGDEQSAAEMENEPHKEYSLQDLLTHLRSKDRRQPDIAMWESYFATAGPILLPERLVEYGTALTVSLAAFLENDECPCAESKWHRHYCQG